MNLLANVDGELLNDLDTFFGNLFQAAKENYPPPEYEEQSRFYKEIVTNLLMYGLKDDRFLEHLKTSDLGGYNMGHQFPGKSAQAYTEMLQSRLFQAQKAEEDLKKKIKEQDIEIQSQKGRIEELEAEILRKEEVGLLLGEIVGKVDEEEAGKPAGITGTECGVCFRPYSRTIIPYVGVCGHSICKRCTKWIKKTDCPICRGADSFDDPIKNFLAAELMCILRDECPYSLIEDCPIENEVPSYEQMTHDEVEGEEEEIIMPDDDSLQQQLEIMRQIELRNERIRENQIVQAAADIQNAIYFVLGNLVEQVAQTLERPVGIQPGNGPETENHSQKPSDSVQDPENESGSSQEVQSQDSQENEENASRDPETSSQETPKEENSSKNDGEPSGNENLAQNDPEASQDPARSQNSAQDEEKLAEDSEKPAETQNSLEDSEIKEPAEKKGRMEPGEEKNYQENQENQGKLEEPMEEDSQGQKEQDVPMENN